MKTKHTLPAMPERAGGLDAAEGIRKGLAIMFPFWVVICLIVFGIAAWVAGN